MREKGEQVNSEEFPYIAEPNSEVFHERDSTECSSFNHIEMTLETAVQESCSATGRDPCPRCCIPFPPRTRD